MLDINFIREHVDEVRRAIQQKGVPLQLDDLLGVDDARRKAINEVEMFRAHRNKVSDAIAREKDAEKKKSMIEEMQGLKAKGQGLEDQLREIMERYKTLMWLVPNIPHPKAPIGHDASSNVEVSRWGQAPVFSFPVIDHVELGKSHNLLDLEKGAEVSGYRGYYLKNEAVLMHMGLIWLGLKKMMAKGFSLHVPPTIVKNYALYGSGHFPAGRDEIYQLANPGKLASGETVSEPLYLVGTAEPSLLAYYADTVIDKEDLPIKVCGVSQCYRSEIGSYGKDTKGIYRIHEFMKVEQVVICENSEEETLKWLHAMLDIAVEILKELELPHRIIEVCTGDMGAGKYKMYDIETWMPSRKSYGETHSNSALTDWQSRRLNIQYKEGPKGTKKFVHTLNNTVIASPRILIAILENNQQADGSILVPKVLREYVGKDKIG